MKRGAGTSADAPSSASPATALDARRQVEQPILGDVGAWPANRPQSNRRPCIVARAGQRDSEAQVGEIGIDAAFGQRGAKARLVLVEALVKEGNDPSPIKNVDIQLMLTNAGGRIRSETEWRSLLNSAGFNPPTIVTTDGISDVLQAEPAA